VVEVEDGANNSAGGGGAGGLRTCASFSVCGATAYPITVGAGGAAGTATPSCNWQQLLVILQFFQQ
jgi:hypothetical protein